MALALLLGVSLSGSYGQYNVTTATCYRHANGTLYIAPDTRDTKGVAWALYNQSLWASGWYELHVHGNATYEDSDIAFCAGMVEGYLSHQGIFDHFKLIKDVKGYPRKLNGVSWYPPGVVTFLLTNLLYIRESVDAYLDDPWWQGIGLVLRQFDGLVAGYDRATTAAGLQANAMSVLDHWFFQSAGDVDEVSEIFKDQTPPEGAHEHCSGLVRLTPDFKDIYFAHDAWSDYRELHGQLKEYDLPIRVFKARRIIFSTRIGKLASYDDFYVADTGLYVLETTMNIYNDDLYNLIVPQAVFTWMRAMHACWTTTSGEQWAKTFIRHNSGTYNNQYIILDTKKFSRGHRPSQDLLWIIEQWPGVYNMTDITQVLVRDGYFLSFNNPWHKFMYELGGYPQKVASLGIYGDYRSHEGSPRLQIVKRDGRRLKTFEDFRDFMRYNQWYRDPYSQGDSAQSIASRYDQRPPTTPYGKRNNFGDLDTKAVKYSEASQALKFHAIASPPYDGKAILPWNFTKYSATLLHDGLPPFWNFSWIEFAADGAAACSFTVEKDCESAAGCGWCSTQRRCMVGNKNGPSYEKCQSGWAAKTTIQGWAVPVIASVSSLTVIFVISVFVLHFTSRRAA